MFLVQLLRIVGWIGIVLVALPGLIAFLLSANVAVNAGSLLSLGRGALVGGLMFLLGSASGAALIALASITKDVRIMRNTISTCATRDDPPHRPAFRGSGRT